MGQFQDYDGHRTGKGKMEEITAKKCRRRNIGFLKNIRMEYPKIRLRNGWFSMHIRRTKNTEKDSEGTAFRSWPHELQGCQK